MHKCYFCEKEGNRSLDAVNWSDATGGAEIPNGDDRVYLCEEHNQECWTRIDKTNFKAELMILAMSIGIPLLLIAFVLNLIF